MSTNENVIALRASEAVRAKNEMDALAVTAGAGVHRRVPSRRQATADGDGVVALLALFQRIIDPVLVVTALAVVTRSKGVAFDEPYMALAVIVALLTFIFFKPLALTQPWQHRGLIGLSAGVTGSWMMMVGMLLWLGAATGYTDLYPTPIVLTWFVVIPPLVIMLHRAEEAVLQRYIRSRRYRRTAAVVGVNELSQRLVEKMTAQPHLGLSFQGFFDDRDRARLGPQGNNRLMGSLRDLPFFAARHKIDVIYIALPVLQQQRILKLLDGLRDTTASIYFVPDVFMFDLIQGRLDGIDGLPVVALCETPFTGIHRVVKRLADVVLAGTFLLLFSPLLGLIALGVKLDAPGPIFFKQRRYGIDGREIVVYKFRTMRVSENGDMVVQARRQDPRVTRFGAFLRRFSLDEFPQFINVLQGNMSVVGPRPHAVAHNEMYRKLIKGYMMRHKVKPGITGWAQVNGLRGATEDLAKMRDRVEHDLDYLRNWSLMLDLKIILKTALQLFRDRHAY